MKIFLPRTYRDSHETIKPALAPSAAKAIAKIGGSQNPVIHAGGGVLSAGLRTSGLGRILDIPVSRTLMGQGCISDTHPLMLGQTGFWGLEFTHRFTANADVLLGLGTRFLLRQTVLAGIQELLLIWVRQSLFR